MIKILVVDDSAIVRQMLRVKIAEVPGLEVVGTAPDAFDFVTKPSGHLGIGMDEVLAELILKIKAGHKSNSQIVNRLRKMTGIKPKVRVV